MVKSHHRKTLLVLGLGAALGACDGSDSGTNPSTPISPAHAGDTFKFDPAGSGVSYSASSTALNDPTVDYMLALRTASLKLRGNMPSLEEQLRLQAAIDSGNPGDAQLLYESFVQSMIFNSPDTFNRQMFHFWRNTLRMGGPSKLTGRFSNTTTMKTVDLDTAPAFAAMLISQDRDMRELFTSQQSTCPSFNLSTATFTPADCFVSNGGTMASPGNNVPTANQAGILTNPGFLAQYYSNDGHGDWPVAERPARGRRDPIVIPRRAARPSDDHYKIQALEIPSKIDNFEPFMKLMSWHGTARHWDPSLGGGCLA